MGQFMSQPQRPDTSAEAFEIADRFRCLAEASEEGDDISSAINAAKYRENEVRYRNWGYELQAEGK